MNLKIFVFDFMKLRMAKLKGGRAQMFGQITNVKEINQLLIFSI